MIFKKPEFYDIFGLGTFSFIMAISLWALKTGNPFPTWVLFILLLIGVAGFIVDGTIVYKTFLGPAKSDSVDKAGS